MQLFKLQFYNLENTTLSMTASTAGNHVNFVHVVLSLSVILVIVMMIIMTFDQQSVLIPLVLPPSASNNSTGRCALFATPNTRHWQRRQIFMCQILYHIY